MNPAMIALGMKLLQSEQGQKILGKIPGLSSLVPMLSDAAPEIAAATKPSTPQEQIVAAITVLFEHMPTDPDLGIKFTNAVVQILGGAAILKEALKPQ